MSNKPMKVFHKDADRLIYDREDSWVRFEAGEGTIIIDSCNCDGDPSLTPAQVEDVIEWMQGVMTKDALRATKGKASK